VIHSSCIGKEEISMTYLPEIMRLGDDPAGIETLYRAARARGEAGEFETAMGQARAEHPGNLLYAAWYYRLEGADAPAAEPRIAWKLAIPLSLMCGIIFGVMMYLGFSAQPAPHLAWFAGPISAVFIVAYLVSSGRLHTRQTLLSLLALAGLTAYAYWMATDPAETGYDLLMLLHLPALA
jgi:hypothetical protein